jgi:hypothetical protein
LVSLCCMFREEDLVKIPPCYHTHRAAQGESLRPGRGWVDLFGSALEPLPLRS